MDDLDKQHRDYYHRRAPIYDDVYSREEPGAQRELEALAVAVREFCRDRRVLEVAAGTGYWTAVAAESARCILATDITLGMLDLARSRFAGSPTVRIEVADAYALDALTGPFDAGLATFWLSHVPKARIDEFLDGLHRAVGVGGKILMADNQYITGQGGTLIAPENSPDTFKHRTLPDGSSHDIVKNYYQPDELRAMVEPTAEALDCHFGQWYWWITYVVGNPGAS